MNFSVIVTQKGGATRRLEFEKDEITIGRMDENDICLPAGNISKKHTRIFFKEGKFIVVDLKSTNGTYVNGKKIVAPQVLKDADQVGIGDYLLNVENGDISPDYAGSYEPTKMEAAEAGPAPLPPSPLPELTGPQPLHQAPSAPPAPVRPAAAPAAAGPGSAARATRVALVRELYAGACEALAAGVEGDLWTAAEGAVRRHLGTMESSGMVPPGLDTEGLAQAATAEVAGLGAIDAYLADPLVAEVAVSGPEVITIVKAGKAELSERFFSSDEALLSAVARLFAPGGTDRLGGFTLFADVGGGSKARIHLVLRRR